MAHSIPPNLYVKTLNLKSKTKNKNNIQDNKRNNKRKFHIPNDSIKSKTLTITSKWHTKSTLCKAEKYPKENTMSTKYMPIIKRKKDRCPTALMAQHREVVEGVLESDVTCPP